MKILTFQQLFESRRSEIDQLAHNLTSKIFREWTANWKSGETYLEYQDEVDAKFLFELNAYLILDESFENFTILDDTALTHDSEYDFDQEDDDEFYQNLPLLTVAFGISPKHLPEKWNLIHDNLLETLRHEIEHIAQLEGVAGRTPEKDSPKALSAIETGKAPRWIYYTLPQEVEANLQGLKRIALKKREPMLQTINNFLDGLGFDPKSKKEIIKVWRKRAKTIPGMFQF